MLHIRKLVFKEMADFHFSDIRDLAAVKAGDSLAYAALLSRYRPLITSLTNSFVLSCGADPLEVRVEAEYALYRAVLSFDIAQDATTFGLYAKVCIRNRLISHFARRRREIPIISIDDFARENHLADFLADTVGVSDALVDAESVASLCARIRKVLSGYENEVFFRWVDAYTTDEIAGALGKDAKSVSNALSRALAKLRQALS